MPAYNASKYIVETVRSIQSQTVTGWELIIVNDGSEDDTRQIAASLAEEDRRIKVIDKDHIGISAVRNVGCAATDPAAHYVAFLDADDVWMPETLHLLRATLETAPTAPAAHGKFFFIDSDGNRFIPHRLNDARVQRAVATSPSRVRILTSDEPTSLEALLTCIMTPVSALVRRAALDKTSGFLSTMTVGQDWHMWIQLARQGSFAFIDRKVIAYRKHDSNVSSDAKRQRNHGRILRRMIIDSPDYTNYQKVIARNGYRRLERENALDKVAHIRQHLSSGALRSAARETFYFGGHVLRYLHGRP